MTIYVKTTDFQTKDGLATGNPLKIVKGTEIDDEFDAIAVADATNLKKDGTVAATGNIPMGAYKFTGLGAGSSANDSANLGQVQAGAYQLIGSISGVDTITGSLSPAISAYAAGQKFSFVSAGANTGAVTININGLGAKSITKLGTTALSAGDIPSGAVAEIEYDGTQFQLCNLVSQIQSVAQIQPISASVAASALTISATSELDLQFRSTTLGSGTVTRVTGTPSNLVISSGSTLGTSSGVAHRLTVAAINNAGTIELAVNYNKTGASFDESGLISTTAEGGAGGADTSDTWYSTTARTNVAYRIIGVLESTQATAGTWATAPSLIQGAGGAVQGNMVRRFTSTDQTITSGGALTIPHGLGTTPYMVSAELVCQSAEANYQAGYVVPLGTSSFVLDAVSGANGGMAIRTTDTNIIVRFGSAATVFALPDWTTGAGTNLTNTNWKIRFKAFA